MRIGRETLRNVSGTDTQRVKGKKKGVGIDDNLGSQSSIIGILRTDMKTVPSINDQPLGKRFSLFQSRAKGSTTPGRAIEHI